MKKKLLVLSASAILASNFILDNNASAVVSKNEYKSDALTIEGKINPKITMPMYQDNIKSLIHSLSVNAFEGYDQPEYKNAYSRYQNQFLAELDALNQFISEDDREPKDIRKYEKVKTDKDLGLTEERYERIYQNLKQNRRDFDRDVYLIEENNSELKRFDSNQQALALRKVYDIEDKVYMVAKAFPEKKHIGARVQLFNKLNLIVGYLPEERSDKLPTNQRMVNEMCEDLETIIDEFYHDIGHKRPLNIEPLNENNKDNEDVIRKVKEDSIKATDDITLRDSNVELRAKKAEERLAKITENSRKAKAEAEQKAKEKLSNKYMSYVKNPEEFKHKKLSQKAKNELSIKFPESSPEFPIYTVATESQPQPVLKQQTKEEKVDVLKSKRPETTLNGLNGESHFVTMDESSNASTQFGSNGHVFEYSFDSTPKTTNVAKQNVKQENYNSVNNLAGMSGESQHVDFTQDSNPATTYGGYGNAFDFTEDTAPKQPETITESHEIVFDEYTDVTVSGYTKGESIEDTNVSTQTNQKN